MASCDKRMFRDSYSAAVAGDGVAGAGKDFVSRYGRTLRVVSEQRIDLVQEHLFRLLHCLPQPFQINYHGIITR